MNHGSLLLEVTSATPMPYMEKVGVITVCVNEGDMAIRGTNTVKW